MLEYLLKALNDCVLCFDTDRQQYVFASAGLSNLTGYNTSDFLNDPSLWKNCIDKRDIDNVNEFEATLTENNWAENSCRLVKPNGDIKWIHLKCSLYYDADTSRRLLISIIKDVSENKLLDNIIKETHADFSAVFENNPSPMWIYDLSTLRILKVNKAAIDHYGYSRNEFLSMTIRDIRPRIDLAKFNDYLYRKKIQQTNPKGFNHAGIWRHQDKSGKIIFVEITGHEIKYEDNLHCRIIIANDVTDKIQYQDELKRREQFLTSLIDSQTNFLIRVDAQGLFSFVNSQFLKVFGYKKNEIIGRHFSITTIPEELPLCENAFQQCLNHPGKVIQLVHRKPDKQGNLHWTEWELIALTNDDGVIIDIQGIGQDITGRLATEQLATDTLHELNTFIESITDSLFMLDNNWRFTRVNPEFEKIIQKSRHEMLGQVIWDIFPSIIGTAFEASYRKAMTERVSVQFTEHFLPLQMWFNGIVYPSRAGLTVIVRDITQEKKAQEELIWTKNNMEALVNNTDDLIGSVDTEYRYMYMNSAFRNGITYYTGLEPTVGDTIFENTTYPETELNIWKNYYDRALAGERYDIKHHSIGPDGNPLWFNTRFNPIYDTNDNVVGVGCFAHNITDDLKKEEALLEQNTRLRNIASFSSHDLRRPVASMIGLINLLDRSNFSNPENEEIIKHLLTVGNEIDKAISQIVNDAER